MFWRKTNYFGISSRDIGKEKIIKISKQVSVLNLDYRVKAGALQLTLFIALVIALLLTTFILLVQTHKRFNIQTDFIIETSQNTNKGIVFALNNKVRLNDTIAIDLKEEDYKSLKVHRDFWGVFEKVTTVSKIKKSTLKKAAIIGGTQPENNRTALYIQDNNKPLVLVGNTKIEGVAYLSRQGVKSGTISGHSYYGSQLIYGATRVSSNLPKLLSETSIQINTIENQISRIPQEQFLNVENGKTYTNSFLKPTQVIFSNGVIQLNTITLTGNIIIQSKTKITVEASSKLKDVILIAPEIEIQNHVKGNFQAIASKEIIVYKNVTLAYPSALILKEKESTSIKNTTPNKIIIEDNVTINGLIVYLGIPKTSNHNVQIELKEKSIIKGEIYCNQNLELKGTVFGTVYTNNFIAKQFGSVYQNHIYNGTITVNKLAEEYIGLPFNNSKKGVLKWLY